VDTHLKPQIRHICVVNLGNSPAITCDSPLDVTNLGFNLLRPELIAVLYLTLFTTTLEAPPNDKTPKMKTLALQTRQ
jgi:hypothetical protein